MSAITKAICAAWREFLREFKRQRRSSNTPDPFKG